ncbi:DUF397 domain-containing protein [Streptomyces pratensis]|uniref:DUF397 domain-containing protein n=1 Tax=Streptomyces pratensis TaxID=1169025 RepID=UPI0019319D2E|nr:DUF397 domain-containing protein [Streptomyces pratensis]
MHSAEHSFTGWYKSSFSGANQGECLEVAVGHPDVPVRDSKTPHGPVIAFSAPHWTTFVAAVVDGRFDA